ncbi:MAG: hypothetical protein U9532_00250 ['Conium maculatum' witches'-broom phytoplasma]|nr:hypothetical protein ['Conium maculatum' witches'-broom phytoplasma]
MGSKLNAFKEETKTDFNHLQQKLDKLIEKASEINEGQKLETDKDQKPVKEPVNRHTVQELKEAGYESQ